MKRVLVGVDGSEASAVALAWAGRLARLTGAEVVVATIFRPDEAEVSPERYESLQREAQQRLGTEWTEPLREAGVEHRPLLCSGSPERLLDVAEREDADLVVVGPRGQSGFASLHVGSLAHHLAHHTRRPLAIVPAPGAQSSIEHIMVGVDGSEGSAAAVRWCADLAIAAKADVLAVHAFEPFVEWVPETDPRSWRQRVEREVSDWVAPLRSASVPLRTMIIKDVHPVAALKSAIEHQRIDLAVVGSRGVGGFSGLRLGRVPVQLVHHTQIPVVLVPASPLDGSGVA